MKPTTALVSALLFACLLIAGCSTSEISERPPEKKAVFIIVDGISADVLETIETPNLDRIIEEGAYTRAWLGGEAGGYSESPTVSAVGYNHLLTGVWSNKHNVYDNAIEAPNYHYWNLFRLYKENHPDRPVAIYSSWLDNRTKLVGDGLEEAGSISIDIHYDGFDVDTLAFPHDYGYVQKIDEHVSERAAESLLNDAPHLSWVYLWYTDDTGHTYGDGEEYYESIKVADRQIGRIWDAVQSRMATHHEEWLFIVTTDHGRRLPDGKHHGGHSERERTIWIITNNADVNPYFENSEPAIVDIYPTIGRHLGLDIPGKLQQELDGVPFMGELSISNPSATYDEKSKTIDLQWTSWDDSGDVTIWLTTTHDFSRGGRDSYERLTRIPVATRQATLDVSEIPSDFYKIVLEAPHNTVNRWVVVE